METFWLLEKDGKDGKNWDLESPPEENKEVRGLGRLCDSFEATRNNDPLYAGKTTSHLTTSHIHPLCVGLPHPRHLGLPQAGGARHLELRDRPAPVSLLSCRPVENFRLSSQPEIEQRAFL